MDALIQTQQKWVESMAEQSRNQHENLPGSARNRTKGRAEDSATKNSFTTSKSLGAAAAEPAARLASTKLTISERRTTKIALHPRTHLYDCASWKLHPRIDSATADERSTYNTSDK